jgi:replicative superfamily II helicase
MKSLEPIERASERILRDCATLKSRLGVEVLFGGITGNVPTTGLTSNELAHIQGDVLWILAVARDLSQSGDIGTKALDFAAETFEYLDSISQKPIASDDIPLSFCSAVLYGGEGKFPNARIMSSKVDAIYKRNLNDAKGPADLFTYLLHCLQLLLKGDYYELQRATTIDEQSHRRLQAILETDSNYHQEFTSIILTYEALRLFASYVLTGRQDFLESSQEKLVKARDFCRYDSMLSLVDRYVSLLFEATSSCHIDRVLTPFRDLLTDEYLALLKRGGRRPIFTLWPPQIRALQQDFLVADHVGVSMPTSSGKTLLAEMKIQAELSRDPSALVFYIVPLNALARQIQKDLQERLRLAPLRHNIKVLTGAYEIEDKDLAGIREENVIVTTPEKLDGLLRNIDNDTIRNYFERCRLFIFDECHSIGDGKRGITYELLVARLRRAFPNAKTLALSAVFSNVADFTQWIGQNHGTCKAIVDSWRPTGSHWATWSVSDGFVYEGTWVNREFKRPADTRLAAAQLAVDMQRAYKNVLIIAESRDACEKYATALVKRVREVDRAVLTPEEQRKLNLLANRIRNRILPDSRLAEWVEFGVAYHHGHLPSDVRAWIEDYTADGTLKFIVSTTTLSEGVNFPIRCVILPNIWVGGRALPAIKLRNIVGRAGRAHVSTSGMAVVFKTWDSIRVDSRRLSFDSYCFHPPESVTQVVSALKDLLEEAYSFYHISAQQALESQILGFLSLSGMQVENQAAEIARASFLKVTNPDLESEIAALLEARIETMATCPEPLLLAGSPYRLTKYGEHVLKTGLGLKDSNLLMQLLREIAQESPNQFSQMGTNDRLDAPKIRQLLLLALTIYESLLNSYGLGANCKEITGYSVSSVRQDSLDFMNAFETNEDFRKQISEAILSVDVELIWRWISGATPQQLGEFLSGKYPKLNGKLELATIEAINVIENLPYAIGWPLYAIRLLIDFLLEEDVFKGSISPQFDNLPYYLKHGVAHPMAVAIMEKVQDQDFRQDSMKVASGYDVEISYPANRESLLRTLIGLGEERIAQKIGAEERAKSLWALLITK